MALTVVLEHIKRICRQPTMEDVMRWGMRIALLLMLVWVGIGYANQEITVALFPGGAPMEMVWIEPGTFMMGSPDSELGRGDEEVQNQVTLSKGFYLGKYELTQGQWSAVMGTQPWSAGADPTGWTTAPQEGALS